MMNAPAVEEAIGRIGGHRWSSFGVHLNLSAFAPLSSHPGLRPLLDEKGEFSAVIRPDRQNLPLTAAIQDGIYAEWCAQIERALALDVLVSHIDSHHHVHTRPDVLSIIKRIRQKFGIRKVRLRPNVSGISRPIPLPRRTRNFAWNFMLRHYAGATTTRGFAAFSAFHERLQAGKRWQGTIELMCHPGRERFAAETELLRGDWLERLAGDAQLISYNELE
jgi:predicted glycoside hydrolase/deacetylase ChbG (UPF0249 family)